MEEEVKEYGLIVPEVEEDHWLLGAEDPDINESGDWSDYDSDKELQKKNGLETSNCTNFGTILALIALASFHKFSDFIKNGSERYTGVMTETAPKGNDPHKVIEVIRKISGLIPEAKLPWTDDINSWEEYYSPNPMDESLVALGQELLKKYKINHKWVIKPSSTMTPAIKREYIKEALRRGTVCVSVRAWRKDNDVYTKRVGEADTHWVWLTKYDKQGYPIIRDQYQPFVKKLAKDYDFGMAKVYFITKNEEGITPVQLDYFQRILNHIAEIVKKLSWTKS